MHGKRARSQRRLVKIVRWRSIRWGARRRLRETLMSPDVTPLLFIAAMIALACTLLVGIYLLFRDEPIPDKKTSKKIVVSNVK
jgi:hypothetical protein